MKQNRKPATRILSIAFISAIPVAVGLTILLLLHLWLSLAVVSFDPSRIPLFACGFLGAAFSVCGSEKMRWGKTLIHELKHAFAVIMSGGSLKKMSVGSEQGSVDYKIPVDAKQLRPFIILAPYSFPLITAITMLGALLSKSPQSPIWSLGMGAALAIDFVSQFEDLHPYQTDFQQIFGGFIISCSFIATQYLLWTALCLHWVVTGRAGFVDLFFFTIELCRRVVEMWC